MDEELRFLARIVIDEGKRLRKAANKERSGRGDTLIALLKDACLRIETDAENIDAKLPVPNPLIGPSLERELFRLRYELQIVHELLAHHRGDPGRQDLPVGIVHLVDELVKDLLPKKADPIIHLDDENMYSTVALVEAAKQLWGGAAVPDPHPVAFNLPALDPANVMLSPILAHEVGHTAWRQGLDVQLNASPHLPAAEAHLRTAATDSGIPPHTIVKLFDSWRQELLCDALATVLTGPSFLFASSVFLPATTGESPVGSHPYPRDRIAYTLRVLDEMGLEPLTSTQVPKIYKWCVDLGENPVLSGDPIEKGLRAAILEIEPTITAVALAAANNGITPDALSSVQEDLDEWLKIEVPPVVASGRTPTPWELVAAAWIFELRRLGGEPEVLASTCSNETLNQFLVKSIELAGIARIWSEA